MDRPRISRRRFLAAAGFTAGATTLALAGLTEFGASEPSVTFPELTLVEER